MESQNADTTEDDKKKPKGFWENLRAGVKNWFRNLRNGPKFWRRRQIISLVSQSAEGKRLLKLANDNGIPIRVIPVRPDDKNLGTVELQWGDLTVGVKVANNGDKVDMATTLHHELRHIEQQEGRGTIVHGFFGNLRDARRQHMISLMEEADAFTAETVEAFRRDRAGQPEYLATMRAVSGRVWRHAESFFEKHPYDSANEAAFAQGLFAHIMQGGIDHYSADYFKDYAETFEKAKTLHDFRKEIEKDPPAPADKPLTSVFALYGGSMNGATSFAKLSGVFLKGQAGAVQETLEMIEHAARKANKLSSKEYRKLRQGILNRSKDLSKKFNSESKDARPKVISGEELQKKFKKQPALEKFSLVRG